MQILHITKEGHYINKTGKLRTCKETKTGTQLKNKHNLPYHDL